MSKKKDSFLGKKIQIIESNNKFIPENKLYIKDANDLIELRNYVLEQTNLSSFSDPEIFFKVMNWVSTRWKHDGLNKAGKISSYEILINASKGSKYRCVEYGKVFSDVLLSFGYIARTIGLKSPDVAYGDVGKAHVASEVWSNELNKWVFIDPQFCIYALYDDKYLNFYEIYQIYKEKKYDQITFMVSEKYLEFNSDKTNSDIDVIKNAYLNDYKNFLKNYFGSIDTYVLVNGEKINLNLRLDNPNDFITFQGSPFGNNVFTLNQEHLYFNLNQIMVIFDYNTKEKERVEKLEKEVEIKTLEEYLEKRYLFYANPDLIISLSNNIVWFSHYEITINDKTETLYAHKFELTLNEGVSNICIKGINKFGISSPITIIKIKYE